MKLCPIVVNGVACRLETTEELDSSLVSLRLCRCPLGHRSYDIVRLTSLGVFRFRKSLNGDTWHFSQGCSQWPTKNFTSIGFLSSEDALCNECMARSRLP